MKPSGRRLMTPIVFGAISLTSCLVDCRWASAQFGPPLVTVAKAITRQEFHEALSGDDMGQAFVGTVEPARRSIVGSAVAGRVIEFPVNKGDRVEKKSPLARLLTRQIEIQIAAAKAQLSLCEHELEELENGARLEERQQSEARELAAQALHEYTRKKLLRTQSLVERKAASTDQLQDDTSAAERNHQIHLEAKAANDLIKAGTRPEKLAQARSKVDASREEVNRLEDQLEKHTIIAPFDGFVVAEHTEVGQWIDQGDPVAEVIEVAFVDVQVSVEEGYISQLRLNAPVRVTMDALPGREFSGQIRYIVPQADLRSRSFPVEIRLANENLPDGTPVIKPGMLGRVSLPVVRRPEAVLVPKDALVLGGPRPLVYVVSRDSIDPALGKVRPVPVKLGSAEANFMEAEGDVHSGDLVVIEGNERLFPPWDVKITREDKRVEEAIAAAKAARADSDSSEESPPRKNDQGDASPKTGGPPTDQSAASASDQASEDSSSVRAIERTKRE